MYKKQTHRRNFVKFRNNFLRSYKNSKKSSIIKFCIIVFILLIFFLILRIFPSNKYINKNYPLNFKSFLTGKDNFPNLINNQMVIDPSKKTKFIKKREAALTIPGKLYISNKNVHPNKNISLKNVYSFMEKFLEEYENLNKESTWCLEIPKIKLRANIRKGVEPKIINEYIGHFKGTAHIDGNVCLAAHNRGFKFNHFSKIYTLQNGDIVNYIVGKKKFTYKVYDIKIINDYDVSCLNPSNNRILTMITCVRNRPSKRLMVRAMCI